MASEFSNNKMYNLFTNIVGESNVVTETNDISRYIAEPRALFHGKTPFVLKPGSVGEVAKLLNVANSNNIPIVPQGGNTGLVGGQVPDKSGTEIILSLERMNKIRNVDAICNVLTVEAGVILETIHEIADELDRLFPLFLSSQGSCQIGGNISTNAGGTGVLAYGNTRELILGVEVVLATGEIWHGLRNLRKDNTGYDLKQMFIGSEGTLGVVTAANLRLFPKPKSQEVAIIGIESPQAALQIYKICASNAGPLLTAFELFNRIGIDFSIKHIPNIRDPLNKSSPWYILIELSSSSNSISTRNLIENIFTQANSENLIQDAVLAENTEHMNSFWHLRHCLSEVQKFEGGSIKHDISVPVADIPNFLDQATKAVLKYLPECRPFAFGHMGDGNIHFNVSQPTNFDKQEFLSKWTEINAIVHKIVISFGGSISAEHGIGRLKRKLLEETKSEVELELMRKLKHTLDPNGILNPRRVI